MEQKSLGKRCVDVAMTQLGVRENPPHSNSGVAIRQYLIHCVRGDTDKPLYLHASNWCMAFQSWCQMKALSDDEIPAHGYRAGVIEAIADCTNDKYSGVWIPKSAAIRGDWEPEIGDLVIFDRSTGKPETSWWRHVSRISNVSGDVLETIGGNESDMVRISEHKINERKILGFIQYPRLVEDDVKFSLTDDEKQRIINNVSISLQGIINESLILEK